MPKRGQKQTGVSGPETKNSGWRKAAVGILVFLACLATAASLVASWVQPLIFNTDRWVQTVAPLPKDPAIAKAVADNTVDALFDSQDVESVIGNALPQPAKFLASPLSSQLRTQTTKVATDFIQSDKFQDIWSGANRLAHDRFVKIIEQPEDGSKLEQLTNKADTVTLDLASVQQQVRDRLGLSGTAVFNPSNLKGADGFAVDLKSKVSEIRKTTTVIDRLHRVLPVVALALFLAALTVSRSRRKTVLVVGLSVMATSAALLIALKVAKPEVVGLAVQAVNQQALAAAWDQLTAAFRSAAVWLMLPGGLIVLAGVLAGPYRRAVRLRELAGIPKLQKTGVADAWRSFQNVVNVRRQWFRGAGVVIAIVALLAASSVTIAGVVGAAAATVGYLSIIELVRPRTTV